MESTRSVQTHLKATAPVEAIAEEDHRLPPWLFQHQDLINTLESAKPVDREALINKLNHIHFTNGYILVHLSNPEYQENILLRAYPDSCLGKELTCRWAENPLPAIDLENYRIMNLIVDEGRSMILIPAFLKEKNGERLIIRLPEISYNLSRRRAKRYICSNVIVDLIQSGLMAKGELLDFSPIGFRIRISAKSSGFLHLFNSDELVTIHFWKEKQIIFSGFCRCIRHEGKLSYNEMVLLPIEEKINRFKKRQIRNPRQQLVPSPVIMFDHPLFKKRVQLEVDNISTSGFSVYEESNERVLISGLIIPDLTINFSGALKIKCDAQVLYCLEEDGKRIRCGLSILDMDLNSYSRLAHVLLNALDPHAYVSSEVDMGELWEFFFDTGFIYPTKYRLIQSYRENLKETYRKLYQENPEIAKNFTYQRNGHIYAHISMIRAYEKTWMMNNHAGRNRESGLAGFIVLKQMFHYLYDMHRLPSANMDYAMSYFRPENKVPNLVFGRFAKYLKNVRGCSMDLFAYLPHTSFSLGVQFPDEWSLKECSAFDLWQLNRFYNRYSGGLLLEAMGLGQAETGDESLGKVYSRLGLVRKWKTYSLTHMNELNAVLIVEQSDMGIHLSEILNSIKIMVINTEGLPWSVLSTAISKLASNYEMDRVPVMFFPFDYVRIMDVPYEKQYLAWVLNVGYGDEYMEFMYRKLRIGYG
jgi:hypothetical protein